MTFIDGWNHIFSQSDRRTSTGIGLITAVTRSSTLAGQEIQNFLDAFSGAGTGSGGPYYIGHSLVAGTDYFQWQMSEAVAINGLRFWGGDVTNNGVWQLQGSNNGSSWTNVGSTFNWNQVNSGIGSSRGCEFTFTNTTAYSYYRLAYVSGTFGGGRLCDRLHFRISHSDLGGGDRSSSPLVTVTAGPTNLGPRNARTVADLVDGLYHSGQPTAGADQVTLNAPAANDNIKFAFGATAVSIRRWVVDGDGQFNSSYGTWQWEGSHNGSSWTASGSSFTLTGNGNTLQLFTTQVPSSSDYYEYWRLKYLSGSTGNLNGMYEFIFDLDETVPGGDASGSIITVTVSGIWGNAIDATGSGATLTVAASLIAGSGFEEVTAPGATVTVTTSVPVSGVVHLQAIDGGAIYEFAATPVQSEVYLVSDYDSIYSRGDRVASGLLQAGEYGWTSIFSPSTQGYDNLFTGNGPAASGTTPGASFWFSTVEGEAIDIRGFTLIGISSISSLENFWSFRGGVSAGNYSDEPYFKLMQAHNPNQLTAIASPAYDNTYYQSQYEDEPLFYNQYAHFEFVYVSGPRPDVRWANEVWLKIAHSNLDGGDRRESTAAPSKKVKWTNSADWSFRIDSSYATPNEAFFDGLWEHVANKMLVGPGKVGVNADPVATVGAWFGFQFPRPVTPKHILFLNYNNQVESYDSGDNPQHYGVWHWEYSENSGASWTQVGGSWSFRADCVYMIAPREPDFDLGTVGAGGVGANHWRMVLEQGPAWGSGKAAMQIIFDLDDITGLAPPYEIHFTDDTDDTPVVATIGPPGSPYVVRLSDGTDDALNFTVQNIPNPVLTVSFTDEGQFDHWSDLYPSVVVQTVVIATGR